MVLLCCRRYTSTWKQKKCPPDPKAGGGATWGEANQSFIHSSEESSDLSAFDSGRAIPVRLSPLSEPSQRFSLIAIFNFRLIEDAISMAHASIEAYGPIESPRCRGCITSRMRAASPIEANAFSIRVVTESTFADCSALRLDWMPRRIGDFGRVPHKERTLAQNLSRSSSVVAVKPAWSVASITGPRAPS